MAVKDKDKGAEKITPRLEGDNAVLFDVRDGVTVRVKYSSTSQVSVEMWRDSTNIIVPPDVGNIFARSFRDKLVKSAREHFNPKPEEGKKDKRPNDTVPNIAEDIGHIATIMGSPVTGQQSLADMLKEESGPTLVDRLVESVEEVGTLFVTPERRAHVSLEIDGHTETYDLEDSRFARWLKVHFYHTERERLRVKATAAHEAMIENLGALAPENLNEISVQKPPVVRDQALADAVSQLQSMALYEGNVEEVHLRVGGSAADGAVYIDLGNEDWEVIEVTAEGWKIITNPPVRFVRSNTMRPQVRPEEGASVEDLRDILTLSKDDEDDEAAWRLILAWLVQSLRPDGGQYPILVLLGGQGSAKTNTGRFLRRLVDPNVVKDTSPPKTEHDLYIRGTASWVISIDNVSTLPHWLSDAICRIATEGGFATRKLYSGREEEVFDSLRPFILNGIADVASRPDILDRALLVTLPAIKKNKPLRVVKQDFAEKEAGILGALLDAVAAGIAADLDDVSIDMELPRLADFAQWAFATEEALVGKPGDFMKAYWKSRGEGTETALEAEPMVPALIEVAKKYSEADPWNGPTKDLLDRINAEETDEALKRSKEWPKTPKKLSELLKRLAPALIEIGVHVEKVPGSRRHGRRINVFYRDPDSNGGGDDGDGEKEATVTTTVTDGYPTTEPDSGSGDDGDGGDGTVIHPDGDEIEI